MNNSKIKDTYFNSKHFVTRLSCLVRPRWHFLCRCFFVGVAGVVEQHFRVLPWDLVQYVQMVYPSADFTFLSVLPIEIVSFSSLPFAVRQSAAFMSAITPH